MRKFLLVLMMVLVSSGALAESGKMGWSEQVPVAYTLTASQTKVLTTMNLDKFQTVGYMALQNQVLTGAVTLKYEVTAVPYVSGETTPEDAWDGVGISDLVTAQAVGWSEVIMFPDPLAKGFGRQLRITGTDTSGTGATGNLYPVAQ